MTSFDPAKGYDSVSWAVERLMFEPLLGYAAASTKLVPLLAKEMPAISNDGKTYTFKLNSGVSFVKPDGSVLREMNADDVVDSLNRVLDPKLQPKPSPVASGFFGNIVGASDVIAGTATTASGIKALDTGTVEIDLVKADATFLNIMATPFGSVLPKGTAHDESAITGGPVGTGPYLLKSYTKGQAAIFVGNPHYWQAGQPYVGEIDVHVGVDPNAQVQQVEAGVLDVMGSSIPSGSFTSLTTDPKWGAQVVHHTLVDTVYLFFDTQQPNGGPLSKVGVRQALEYAIDKDAILTILHGSAIKADCIYPPDMPGFDPNCHPYNFNQDKARQLLAAAGFPSGFSTAVYTDNEDPDPAVAQSIQQDLAAIGVTATVGAEEADTFFKRVATPHQAPMGYLGWNQDYPDPSDFIDPILSCATAIDGGSNYALYCDPTTDAMAVAARAETDPNKRISDYQAIENRIMEAAPWVPLEYPNRYAFIGTRVDNFQLHPVWIFDLRDVRLKPGA